MPMTEKQFQNFLMLYGTEVENWPDEILAEAMRAKHHPVLSGLAMEQQCFDEMLLNSRRFEAPSADLADRIIYAARIVAKTSGNSLVTCLRELLTLILPQPAFALATVLSLGIVIGFSVSASLSANGTEPLTQTYFEDDGATL